MEDQQFRMSGSGAPERAAMASGLAVFAVGLVIVLLPGLSGKTTAIAFAVCSSVIAIVALVLALREVHRHRQDAQTHKSHESKRSRMRNDSVAWRAARSALWTVLGASIVGGVGALVMGQVFVGALGIGLALSLGPLAWGLRATDGSDRREH